MAPAESASASEPPQTTEPRWFPSRGQLFLALAIYFGWHLICRVLISTSVDLDESEQFVLTQRLLWGYGSQPPLYTWIQSAFFHLFGLNIFALALLKNLLLFSLAALTYANARRITENHAVGVVAVMSLAFVPQVVWESQRDLTHSVLASVSTLTTLYTFVWLAAKPGALRYGLLGLCIGLGVLSKYNYVFFALGLFAAALTVKGLRHLVLDRRTLLTLFVGGLVVLPNGLWMVRHSAHALQRMNKFQIHEDIGWLSAVSTGFRDMGLSVLLIVAPMVLVLTAVFWKPLGSTRRPDSSTPMIKLTRRILPGVLAAVALLILSFRVTEVKERWFQPLLIAAPVVAATWLQPRLNQRRVNWLMGLVGLVAVIVIAAIPGRYFLAERLHREETLTRPYKLLADELNKTLSPQTTLVAATPLLAGNLRLHLPTRRVTTPELAELFPLDPQNVVLIWEATRKPALPTQLSDFAVRRGLNELTNQKPAYVSAPYYFRINKQARLGSVKREAHSISPAAPVTATNPETH